MDIAFALSGDTFGLEDEAEIYRWRLMRCLKSLLMVEHLTKWRSSLTLEEMGNLGEAVGAIGVIFSLVYLGLQISQQNKIAKAQFGHTLTQRLYDRYFQTSKDGEYAAFMSLDWNSDELSLVEVWRIQMALLTYFVDLFDVYDKVQSGLVDRGHLDTRMRTLKLGVMKTKHARHVWNSWKLNRTQQFVEWFEMEIYGGEFMTPEMSEEELRRIREMNVRR